MSDSWSNKDNKDFYEKISLKVHKHYAKLGGVANHEDLQIIESYITAASSILEVGAGYGRVLEYLVDHCSSCDITAIERSTRYYYDLSRKFKQKVRLFNVDLLDFSYDSNYDLILWMASGISDFPKPEQLAIVKKLTSWLNEKGILIIDVFSSTLRPVNITSFTDQSYSVKMDDYLLRGYTPTTDEVIEYAKQAAFNSIEHIPYKTSTNRDRNFIILSK